MNELLVEIENKTGFTCYELSNMVKAQYTFYGSSAKYEEFKTLAGTNFKSGTIVYLMDSGISHMYDRYNNVWY